MPTPGCNRSEKYPVLAPNWLFAQSGLHHEVDRRRHTQAEPIEGAARIGQSVHQEASHVVTEIAPQIGRQKVQQGPVAADPRPPVAHQCSGSTRSPALARSPCSRLASARATASPNRERAK